MVENNWTELSPDERRAVRFERWLSPPQVNFNSPEAENLYKERVTRLIAALRLEVPDRVPVMIPPGFSPVSCAGIPLRKAMYDYDELLRVTIKFLREFETDTFHGPDLLFPAQVLDNIDFKSFKWPGHGLSADAPTYQYVEGEYMKADEYEHLIEDPSDFWMRVYLPRVAGAFDPLKKLSQLSPLVGIPVGYLVPYGMPDVQAAFQVLLEAGRESFKWAETVGKCNQLMMEMGIPQFWGGIAMAPFDGIADMMRGTQGTILDMFRWPDKLTRAMEKITSISINAAINAVNASGSPLVFIPLHKGADGFMSDEQFVTFYWPTLKQLCLGLINEGAVPLLFAEGGYNSRLERIGDLPRGSAVWWFDQTDMARAKDAIGDKLCICGNVHASMICTGTPGEVKECCREIIEVAGKGGGLILTAGAFIDAGNPDNLRAVMEAAKEYGVYKK